MAQVPGWQFAAVNFQRRFAQDSGLIRIDEVDVAKCQGLWANVPLSISCLYYL